MNYLQIIVILLFVFPVVELSVGVSLSVSRLRRMLIGKHEGQQCKLCLSLVSQIFQCRPDWIPRLARGFAKFIIDARDAWSAHQTLVNGSCVWAFVSFLYDWISWRTSNSQRFTLNWQDLGHIVLIFLSFFLFFVRLVENYAEKIFWLDAYVLGSLFHCNRAAATHCQRERMMKNEQTETFLFLSLSLLSARADCSCLFLFFYDMSHEIELRNNFPGSDEQWRSRLRKNRNFQQRSIDGRDPTDVQSICLLWILRIHFVFLLGMNMTASVPFWKTSKRWRKNTSIVDRRWRKM